VKARRERAVALLDRLSSQHPDAAIELRYSTPLELLVATILSAQCTDVRVNQVTETLFRLFRRPEDYLAVEVEELERAVQPTGFFRQKTAAIRGCCAAILERHDGQVPRTTAELVALPGVGRKTANVVLNIAFGQPTIAVDTHIFRVANRTGLAPGKNPLEVELGLLERVPERFKRHAHHWLILHGRYVCKARKPECPRCLINDLCRWPEKTV
jgi:endonuclease-3